MTTLSVGAGQQYSTIASAVNASKAGDTISVLAGTYTNDFVQISHDLTLQAVGGRVSMVATVAPPNGKAILTEGGAGMNVSITGFDFSGAAVPDGNGAGIRYEGGNLTLTNDYFHDNQDGLLGAADKNGSITIANSEFAHNGGGSGNTHNIYVGDIARLSIDSSYFHDAVVGHEIKSRAENTSITNSRIIDGPTGTASYSIDLPNGGDAVITGNVIEQGPQSQNSNIIAYGEEGGVYASSSLKVTGNTILNDLGRGSAVWNTTSVAAVLQNNAVFGFGGTALLNGVGTVAGSTVLAVEPVLNLVSPLLAIAGAVVTPPATTTPVTTTPPATTTPVTTTPVTTTPSGTSFVLHLSEDAYNGDANFLISVDGAQVGGTRVATAAHAAGATQTFDLTSLNLGAGLHDVGITFINDAYGGAGKDRNLFVDDVQFGGITQAGTPLWSNGSVHYTVGTPPAASSAVKLVLNMSEDAWAGDANFILSVDGIQRSITQVVTASHAAGASQAFDFTSLGLAAGHHDIGVTFTNDDWGGVAGKDRNLYVDNVQFGGSTQSGGALYTNGTLHFSVG